MGHSGDVPSIREAVPEEYPILEDILVSAFTTGCWVDPHYEENLRTLSLRSRVMHVWVAVDHDDRPLALALTPRPEYWDRSYFTFSTLAVSPSARGLGIGALLIDYVVGLARNHGFSRIQINSSHHLYASHRLYYAKGFVRRPERETFFASAYDERLLALSYRIPDPLPPGQVIRVERKEPAFTLPFGPHTAVRIRPERPAGVPDGCGAFVIDRTIPDAVLTRAERVAQKLSGCASAPEREGKDGIGSTAVLRRQLLNDVWAGAYAALWSEDPDASTAAAQVFYARLDVLERRLAATGSFLAGSRPGEEDALLFSLLLAYDLNWRPGFGQSAPAVADWPHLWRFAKKLLVSARLSNGELCDAGLSPRPDGSFAEPYGPIPAIEGIGDPRTEWLQASDALRTRLPPRDPGVPNTPYSDDLPPAPPDDRQRVARLAERVSVFERRLSGNDAEADAVGDVRTDLVASLQTLAEGARAADQIAVRRLFFARLGWFEARLAKTVFLNGDQAGGADHALAEVLSEYAAGLDRILTPIDPVLDDFPGLAALYSRLSAKRQGAANRSHGPPRGRARKTVKPKQTK